MMVAGRAVLLVGLALGLAACGNLNPLNWFSNDEVEQPAELTDITPEVRLRRQWSVSVGNGQGDGYNRLTPAVSAGVIFAAAENGEVMAVDATSGDRRWRVRLRDTVITGGVGAGAGLVLVGTRDAEVVALDAADGQERWRVAVTSEVLSAPQTNGDIVAVQTVDDKLVALNANDGSQRWIYETTLPVLTLRGTSQPLIVSGVVVAGFSNGTIVAVNAADGVWRWEERVAVPQGRYDIERVIDVDGELLLTANNVVMASSYQGNLMGLDVATGRIVWGMEASSFQGLAEGFGNIYYCTDRSHVVALRANSDTEVWRNDSLDLRQLTSPTAFGNYLAVGDLEGYVHLLSQIDGHVAGRLSVDGDGVRARPLVVGNALVVYGNSGRLSAYAVQ